MNFSFTSMPTALMFSTNVVAIEVEFWEPSATMKSKHTGFFWASSRRPLRS